MDELLDDLRRVRGELVRRRPCRPLANFRLRGGAELREAIVEERRHRATDLVVRRPILDRRKFVCESLRTLARAERRERSIGERQAERCECRQRLIRNVADRLAGLRSDGRRFRRCSTNPPHLGRERALNVRRLGRIEERADLLQSRHDAARLASERLNDFRKDVGLLGGQAERCLAAERQVRPGVEKHFSTDTAEEPAPAVIVLVEAEQLAAADGVVFVSDS